MKELLKRIAPSGKAMKQIGIAAFGIATLIGIGIGIHIARDNAAAKPDK